MLFLLNKKILVLLQYFIALNLKVFIMEFSWLSRQFKLNFVYWPVEVGVLLTEIEKEN